MFCRRVCPIHYRLGKEHARHARSRRYRPETRGECVALFHSFDAFCWDYVWGSLISWVLVGNCRKGYTHESWMGVAVMVPASVEQTVTAHQDSRPGFFSLIIRRSQPPNSSGRGYCHFPGTKGSKNVSTCRLVKLSTATESRFTRSNRPSSLGMLQEGLAVPGLSCRTVSLAYAALHDTPR